MSLHPIDDLLISVIKRRMAEHPRSLQKRIGPSEVGIPCDRQIAYKLNDTPVAGHDRDRWRPQVGTFVHAGLADWFEDENELLKLVLGTDVFGVEGRVLTGHIQAGGGYDVYGHGDLFVIPHKGVVDWKIVGKNTLDTVRRAGDPGDQYRIQGHGYGVGWANRGFEVEDICVMFLPASGTLDQRVFWHEPFDPSIYTRALERIDIIQDIVDNHGDNAPALCEGSENHCMSRCDWYRPNATDLRIGCPGMETRRRDPIYDILGE